jgi:hypothetical protein
MVTSSITFSLLNSRNPNWQHKWVKGHSGDILNEATDKLAKNATQESNPLVMASFTSMQFFLRCDGGILNKYPRTTLKEQAKLEHLNCFRSSSHFSNLAFDQTNESSHKKSAKWD